jgi:pimeloyl-ACP methyl ester carboxylesterase
MNKNYTIVAFRSLMPKITAFVLIVFFLLSISGRATAQVSPEPPQPQPGVFAPAPCWTDIPPQMTDLVTCGYVSVPERHANPDGQKIRLAVMIIQASEANAQADPLFLLQGGPGGSTIDTYATLLLTTQPIINNRDLVLFDQRGTLYSQPSLICTEYHQLLLDTIEEDLTDEAYLELETAAYQACRQRLLDEGVDLGAYNSLENAADIQAIRQALGYDQINLYGVSYGTLLAQHAMRFFPENLRSVILDAVVAPQTNFLLEVPQTAQRAFTQLFEACAQDPQCSQSFPDLENRFYQVVDTFNQSPIEIPLTDPESGITYQAIMDGDTFLDGVFQLLYVGDLIPAIPQTIVDAEQGNFDFFARILSILVFDRTTSYGMYFSVLCSEDADFSPDQVSLEGVHPQLAEAQAEGPAQFLETCDLWQVESLSAVMDEPVSSQIPVLILSGDFDPITPPINGRAVAQTLPNSFVVEFPTGGHGAALDGTCQDQIIRDFLDQPEQKPDTSCIAPLESLEFYTPQSVIKIPAALELLNLQNNRPAEFLILIAASLILFPSIFVIPGRWLLKQYRQATLQPTRLSPAVGVNAGSTVETAPAAAAWKDGVPISPPLNAASPKKVDASKFGWLSRAAPWLYWIFSITNWLFLLSFFAILGFMLAQNDNRLFFGFPGQARFLFSMPLILLITAALLSVANLASWFSRREKLLTKIGLTLGWLLCLTILIILARWDILFAIF